MGRLQFSTARENWPITTGSGNCWKQHPERRHDPTELPTTIFPAMLCKGRGKMAMDNSCARIIGEESEHPPLTSCSQKSLF
jgi:hypothetical protein